MNSISRRSLLAIPTTCLVLLAAPASARAPNHAAILRTLFENFHVVLPASQSCGDTQSTSITVGRYMERTLSFLAEEPTNGGRLQAACAQVPHDERLSEFYGEVLGRPAQRSLRRIPRGEGLHQCNVTFSYASGENVWSRGIQFLLRENTGRAVEHTFRCLMTP